VAARREGDRIIVFIPAGFSPAEEARWVKRMVDDVLARESKARTRSPRASDQALAHRVDELNRQYFARAVTPSSVRWVQNMAQRWGSCTPTDRTIRISHRLGEFPSWVLDYVLMHELAHLQVSGHGADFWSLVERYPRTERARGFLEGVATAAHFSMDEDSL
jgi:predicted metal-dependent hydrolase